MNNVVCSRLIKIYVQSGLNNPYLLGFTQNHALRKYQLESIIKFAYLLCADANDLYY
jgi:hypothetical protein